MTCNSTSPAIRTLPVRLLIERLCDYAVLLLLALCLLGMLAVPLSLVWERMFR